MSDNLKPARVSSPGQVLWEELQARGWTIANLSDRTGVHVATLSYALTGCQEITPDIAARLSRAFGTSAEFWLNLEANYRRHNA